MDQEAYREAAGQRFTGFGGFVEAGDAALPPLLSEWADLVLEREEPGLLTLVTFISLQAGSLLPPIRDQLATTLTEAVGERRVEGLGVLLLISEGPIDREIYDRVQQLTYQGGKIRVVPWIVDLTRGRLFGHDGPPFGIDPDLAMLASPAVERSVRPLAQGRSKSARPPWVTVGLMAILVGIWVAMSLMGRSLTATEDSEVLYRWGAALRPHLIEDGEYWRLFTAGFLHIGVAHLLMNSLSLWWVGQVVEVLYGPVRMLLIYLIALVAGSVASLVLGPPIILSAGASGAIFGLLGALLWYRMAGPERHRLRQMPLIIIVLINLGYGLIAYKTIDNWNHLGGLLGGFVAAAAVGFLPKGAAVRGRLLVHLLATLLLVGLAGATLAGAIPLPGSSQRLIAAMEAWDQGRLEEAQKGLESVAAKQPDDPRLQLALAWIYFDQGRYTESRASLNRLFRLDPGNQGGEELLQHLEQAGKK